MAEMKRMTCETERGWTWCSTVSRCSCHERAAFVPPHRRRAGRGVGATATIYVWKAFGVSPEQGGVERAVPPLSIERAVLDRQRSSGSVWMIRSRRSCERFSGKERP
jgi:hypothetical protein